MRLLDALIISTHYLCHVIQLCGDNAECIFDTIVAGPEVGAETLEAVEEFEAILEEEAGESSS